MDKQNVAGAQKEILFINKKEQMHATTWTSPQSTVPLESPPDSAQYMLYDLREEEKANFQKQEAGQSVVVRAGDGLQMGTGTGGGHVLNLD